MTDALPPDPAILRRRAASMAYSLGIALYITVDGRISQHPPGERIEPPPGAVPTAHGHGNHAEVKAQP